MRILAITNLYPRPGQERRATFNRQQFRALARRHELRVVAPVAWTEALREWIGGRRLPGSYVNDDGIQIELPTFYYPPRVLAHCYGEFYLACVRATVKGVVKEFRPDAILACWAHPDGWAAVQLAREAGLPVVVKVIGTDILVLSRGPRRRRKISETFQQADGVVAVSRHLAEHAERLGADPQRLRVVPEGLDEALFFPGSKDLARQRLKLPAHRRIILFVGNLLRSKGATLVVEACRLLRANPCDFRCYLVGSGRDERRLHRLIRKNRLDDRVTLAGPVPHDRLGDWYRASDVVTLPSDSEGIPNVLRESLACGRPFVATRVGGIPEIAHPAYSRLIERGDVEGLARELYEMLRSPPEVERSLVENCNVSCEESAAQLAEVVEQAVAERRSKSMPSQYISA